MTELKPCPFCGSNADITGDIQCQIYCATCGASTAIYAIPLEAEEMWNNRFQPLPDPPEEE